MSATDNDNDPPEPSGRPLFERVAPATAGGKPPPVRSGLAKKRRNPVLAFLEAVGGGVVKFLTKDWLTTALLLASIALVITFFVLLSSIQPGQTGKQFPLSRVLTLAGQHQIADATLLDHDDRVVVDTFDGQRFYANYPSSGAATSTLISSLTNDGARVTVDPQSGKPERQILVQFLIPIVLLVCLFAFFTRLSAAPARPSPNCVRSGISSPSRPAIRASVRPHQRACCWSGRPEPARRCWPRRRPARPTRRSSRCPDPSSSNHL